MNSTAHPLHPASAFEDLCRQVRGLAHDSDFVDFVRPARVSEGDALRYILDTAPEFEMLPIEVLAHEVHSVLRLCRADLSLTRRAC